MKVAVTDYTFEALDVERAILEPMGCQVEFERTGCMPVTLDQMLRTTDVITLHCPSIPSTRGMIDAAAFRTMKPGALFINVARGRPGLGDRRRRFRPLHGSLNVCDAGRDRESASVWERLCGRVQ